MAVHAGSWWGLPDFGVTEAIGNILGKPRTAQGGSNLIGPPQASYTPPSPQVLGASTSASYQPAASGPYGPFKPTASGGGAPSTNNPNPTGPTPTQMVQSNQDNGNSQIEADFNQAMAQANSAEQGLRGQADTGMSQIGADTAAASNELKNNQTQQQQGINQSVQTAQTQGNTAMQQARDLFRQTQQNNTAQMSALGISSSSVSEALAERLGVETARRIAGVTGSLQEVRTNAANELNRVNQYYQGKLEDVTRQADIQKQQIQQSLMQGLNSINGARQQAASDKASARANLLSQVQQQLYSLSAQQQQFEQSMQQWREQKAAALQPIVQDPNYVQNIIAQSQNINQQFAPTGFVATPSFNVNQNGQYTGQINMQKKQQEDPLAQLYAQAGVGQ